MGRFGGGGWSFWYDSVSLADFRLVRLYRQGPRLGIATGVVGVLVRELWIVWILNKARFQP